MAQMNFTASELNTAKQKIQNKYAKIELLNFRYQVVDTLEGIAINGSFTVDADSDMRRSATIKFFVLNSSFALEPGGEIWIDKYIRIYLGTFSITEQKIIYSKIGTFVVDAPSYEYDVSNNSVQLSLLDLMSKLSGVRNGNLPGMPLVINAGESIRTAIISTLQLGGFTKYICQNPPSPGVVPNEIKISQGATVYSVLSQLRDIYPNYEIYFDVDGIFHYEPIPTGRNEPVQIDDTLWDSIVIGETVDVDFQNVKNFIEVWGRTHEPEYFSIETMLAGNVIHLSIPDVEQYTDGVIYGFTLNNLIEITNPSIQINELSILPIKENGRDLITIPSTTQEVYYCVSFEENDGIPYANWLGHLQAYGEAKDINPNSPFYINGSSGIIRLPLYGGDYENCYTDYYAQQRANYELYKHSHLNDTITLTCVPVPWLEVNTLVSYTTKFNNKTNLYLIKSFGYGFDIDDTMSITLMRFYPEYPVL